MPKRELEEDCVPRVSPFPESFQPLAAGTKKNHPSTVTYVSNPNIHEGMDKRSL